MADTACVDGNDLPHFRPHSLVIGRSFAGERGARKQPIILASCFVAPGQAWFGGLTNAIHDTFAGRDFAACSLLDVHGR